MKSALYRSYKRFTVFSGPILAGTIIFLDWYHTYKWKKAGCPPHAAFRALYASNHPEVLEQQLQHMGTFTVKYFVKKVLWDRKYTWLTASAIYYFGQCWTNSGLHRVKLMKGKSQMYADRIAAIPPGEDIWRW